MHLTFAQNLSFLVFSLSFFKTNMIKSFVELILLDMSSVSTFPMSLEMCLLPEGLAAMGATERPHVLVHSHVHIEIVVLFEPLATHFAVLKFPVTSLVASNI